MVLATVDLGSFTLAACNSQVTLSVTTTCCIDVPPELGSRVTADDLAAHVQGGNLWMAKANRCHMVLTTTTNGIHATPPQSESSEEDYLGDAVKTCPVWCDLRLDLSPDQAPENLLSVDSAPTVFLTVHHPHQPEALVVPEGVSAARLISVACNFAFETRQGTTEESQSSSQAPQRDRRRGARSKSSQYITPQSSQSQGTQSDAPRTTNGVLSDTHLRPVAHNLVDTAIHSLVGIKKLKVGWDVIEASKFPTLLDLAPAVWNFHYLEGIAARSAYIPSIANIRESLDLARSSEVSRRVPASRPTERHAPDEDSVTDLQARDSGADTERRLWEILITNSTSTKRSWSRSKIRKSRRPQPFRRDERNDGSADLYEDDNFDVLDHEDIDGVHPAVDIEGSIADYAEGFEGLEGLEVSPGRSGFGSPAFESAMGDEEELYPEDVESIDGHGSDVVDDDADIHMQFGSSAMHDPANFGDGPREH